VIPARDGTLRVLNFAKQTGVKRVLFTSSFNAVGYGHPDQAKPFTEESWSDEKAKLGAYPRSKVVAEKAAWDYVNNGAAKGLELTAINPVAMFGPPLNTELAASLHIIQRYLTDEMPASLNLWMSVVDVRDVAALHVLAMTNPAAQGERFIAVAGGGWMQDIPITLKEKLPDVTQKMSTKVLPNIITRMAGWFDRQVGTFVPELGRRKISSSEKAISMLGWSPRSREDTLVDTAQALIKLGLVKTT
jgi:dihydroflavonol-4-reductase